MAPEQMIARSLIVLTALTLAVSACMTGPIPLTPQVRGDLPSSRGPLPMPPSGGLRGTDGELPLAPVYTPTTSGADAGATSLRCVPRANGLGSDCRPL